MMWGLPELSLSHGVQWIRIPSEVDVPVTARVKSLIDSSAMRRLARVSQLGLVSLVYPGATHSRFEHSLGVYRLAVQVLTQLARDSETQHIVSEHEAKLFLVSALLHDVGHWPYCHPLEDMHLDWIPRHEALARELLCSKEIEALLQNDWQLTGTAVAEFLVSQKRPKGLLQSLLSGPIDVDKMDYLQRDSLHAGVPYGRNFDVGRLINSICLGQNGSAAITAKGRTAAEMMVFARYVMFSEVYWHHAVRSATAMLQRVVFQLGRSRKSSENLRALAPERWLHQSELEFANALLDETLREPELHRMTTGLFGAQRKLYKRIDQFSFTESPEVHGALARRPYSELVQCAVHLSEQIKRKTGLALQATDVLIDAPPVKLEVQFQIDVRQPDATYQPLAKLSPVVNTLATNQFDNFVKRVRVFVRPEWLGPIRDSGVSIRDELMVASEKVAMDSP